MNGLMGAQGAGAWTDMQNAAAAAASFYQRQAGLAGSTGSVAFDPSSSGKVRGLPYRTSVSVGGISDEILRALSRFSCTSSALWGLMFRVTS